MEAIIGLAIEIGKCIVGPVKRQFNYLCCFNDNIQILRDEAQKLKDANDELHMRVDAEACGRAIYPRVKTWLESASQSKDIINGIENKIPVVQKERLNLFSRYSLSRKAKKTAEALRELHNNCKFEQISQDVPPASQESLPLGPKEKLDTRKEIEEDVMKALRGRNIHTVGLYGMGGIGKTTMAKRIMDRVKEEKLFDEVVMVVVSQQADILKLQKSIADQLRLTLDAEDLMAREYKIRTRLRDTKGILIVVDDVWKYLELEKLGIPSENTLGRCTVLLTSRNRGVLEEMETQKIFGIKLLCERESWLLFREKSDNCADREDLQSVAKDITKECNGLPVALVTVGRALRNKPNRQLWDNALAQLRSHNPAYLPEVLANVYKPLKLSYDSLESAQAKSLFLLCSMFKEDSDIDIQILTRYLMGLGMFEHFQSLNEVRNRTLQLVEMLKDRCLLLDGSSRRWPGFFRFGSVRMHDVVRDMAIYITSEEQRCGFVTNLDDMSIDWASWEDSYKDCSWISISNSSSKTKFSVKLRFPSLRLLSLEEGEKLSDRFFDEIRKISVLSMTRIQIKSLPSTTQLLKSLKILFLHNCGVKSISIVGELSNLEVLYCLRCDYIKDVPAEIGRLNRLRSLEIICCISLRTIVRGVIASLGRLEELSLQHNLQARVFPVAELKSLTRLTRLEIETNDVTSIAQEIHFPADVEEYSITVGEPREWLNVFFQKIMYFEIPGEINLGNWIKKLLRKTEFLYLGGDGANRVNFAELEDVKHLVLYSCSTMKQLVDTRKISNSVAFHTLENLRELKIYDCHNLVNLFPVSIIVRSNLSQLEKISVDDCQAMEGIFYNDDDNEMAKSGASHRHPNDLLPMVFPKLTELILSRLSELTIQRILDTIIAPCLKILELKSFKDNPLRLDCSANCLFSGCFNNLVSLKINGFNGIKNLFSCSTMKQFVDTRKISNSVAFHTLENLRELEIDSCHNLLNLFPMSIIVRGNLSQLEKIRVSSCRAMEGIFYNDEDNEMAKSGASHRHPNDLLPMVFLKLTELILSELSELTIQRILDTIIAPGLKILKLESFKDNPLRLYCSGNYLFSGCFNNLVSLTIDSFNGIKNLMSLSVAGNLLCLKDLQVLHCNMLEVIVDDEEQQMDDKISLFPALSSLILLDLDKLRSFCQWKCDHALEMPSLETVFIDGCRKMENFTLGYLTTPKLQEILIDFRVIEIQDLNKAVKHFKHKENLK